MFGFGNKGNSNNSGSGIEAAIKRHISSGTIHITEIAALRQKANSAADDAQLAILDDAIDSGLIEVNMMNNRR